MSASLCFTSLFVGVFVLVSAGQKTITAESGQEITLTCRAPINNNKIIVAEWSRADLETKYVVFYRNGKFAPAKQHPSFKNRVDLQDRQMKDGDVSVILKDVMVNDTGTYECHVFMEGAQSWELRSVINLRVVPEQKIITAKSGQDATLRCQAPNNNIMIVEWSRADLEPDYVLFYQDGQFVPDEQHPSFKNRVDLQDRQMKDGDVSLTLKDVTINDAGTYECYVVQTGTNRRKRAVKPISIITLSVAPPPGPTGGDRKDGAAGVVVGLTVLALLVVGVGVVLVLVSVVLVFVVVSVVVGGSGGGGGFVIYRKRLKKRVFCCGD